VPECTPEEERGAVGLYRELARGAAGTVERLGKSLKVPLAEAEELLGRPSIRSLTYRDAQGALVGVGGVAVAPIWADFMIRATALPAYQDAKDFNMPAGVQAVTPTPAPGAFTFDMGASGRRVTFPDGLQYVDLKAGDGDRVAPRASVEVNYTGWLANGQEFDSSLERKQSLCAILAPDAQPSGDCTPVIPGWDEGVPGMRVHGERRLIIPPNLAYGSQGQGPIPPGSTGSLDRA